MANSFKWNDFLWILFSRDMLTIQWMILNLDFNQLFLCSKKRFPCTLDNISNSLSFTQKNGLVT